MTNLQNDNDIKKTLLRFVCAPVIIGVLTGGVIFLFKYCISLLLSASSFLYTHLQNNPQLLPIYLLCAVALGTLAIFVLNYSPESKGGGIPSSIALIRNLITFAWLRTLLTTLFSSLISFFVGIPVGSEGPSVHTGTCLANGVCQLLKINENDKLYLSSCGACAGFASATSAPISGILFAFEEVKFPFAPSIVISVALCVFSSLLSVNLLSFAFNQPTRLFEFTLSSALPLQYSYISIIVGLVCTAFAFGFTKLYTLIFRFFQNRLSKIQSRAIFISLFAIICALGFFNQDLLFSGHDIIEILLHENNQVWYILLIVLLTRALVLLLATNSGITGGLFVPTLTFGAIIGSLIGNACINLGILPSEYLSAVIILSISSCLCAMQRTVLISIVFAFEVFGAVGLAIPLILSCSIPYAILEIFKVDEFVEVVIEQKAKNYSNSKS